MFQGMPIVYSTPTAIYLYDPREWEAVYAMMSEFVASSLQPRWAVLLDMLLLRGPDRSAPDPIPFRRGDQVL